MSDRDTLATTIFGMWHADVTTGQIADAVIASGWTPPGREITTAEQLAELDTAFPCVIRENPADSTDFYPAMWEMGFQVGWCRAGQMYDPDDCTPTLPATVLVLPTEEAGRG